jgi:hypothetical protein
VDPIDQSAEGYSLNDAGPYEALALDDPIVIRLSTMHCVENLKKAIFR